MERKYAYCVGDVVAYDGLTYDIIKATYGYIVIKNESREIKIKNKGDFKKLTVIQESTERIV